MKKFTLILSLVISFAMSGQSDTVTFQVDLNSYSGTFTTAYVNATFNSWCGSCNPMSDTDGDGVWEVALPLSAGAIEYKFTLDGWTAQENLTPNTPCTVTNNGFTNRSLSVSGDTVLPVVCWNLCTTCPTGAQIDLPIDWEGTSTIYTVTDFGGNASQVVQDPTNANNMVLESVKSGSAATWAGTTLSTPSGLATAIPFSSGNTVMTVDVWSPDAGIEVRLKAEDHTDPTKSVETVDTTTVAGGWQTLTFDFANQASGTAAINFGYTYDMVSIFYNFGVDGATAGSKTYYCDDVMFGAGNPPGTYNVTFQVDMNNYTGSFTTPEVNGVFNGWCGNCSAMSDSDGDNIWDITVPVAEDSIEYKFSFDNWTGQENLVAGSSCTKTTGNFTNRFMYVTKDTVLDAVCWESCVNCASAPANVQVTFQVDLSEYTGSYTEVNLNGTFNSWCGSCAVMTDANNDSIYEITVTVPADTMEYKFTLDGWTTDEQMMQGMPCTITTTGGTGTFTNRYAVPSSDTTLPAVCWEACSDCESIGLEEGAWFEAFTIHPNPSNGVITVEAELLSNDNASLQVLNLQGKLIYSTELASNSINETIDLGFADNGLYLVRLMSDNGVHTEKIMIAK